MPTYAFRTGKGDEDIDDILSRVPASARSWFLREAVRVHAGLSDELKKAHQNIDGLLACGGMVAVQKKQEANNDMGMDDLLALGIEDLLA